ncbi:MAG: aldehyde dehydrogenase [Halobacteriovoraceae bacterium]|nr:aldehyde dehydrogenase [Halobacteriovoraceae bacterium]|tara:strand:+ start:758 stop:1600 length:843 start_codon:yes stop_codon:yes gene_type:complete
MEVLKTVKMYVGGAFIRSESGNTEAFIPKSTKEEYARVCVATRKDFRNAVVAAKDGAKAWSKLTAYNRSQIMYRMAEMAQARESELINLLLDTTDKSEDEIVAEVQEAIDTFVYYAGWCDKYQQVMGSVNPVAAPYHNFTSPENMGVVVHIDSNQFNLAKLVDNICAILVGGNSVISLVSSECPAVVTNLGEIFETSDLPAGVVNLLSGSYQDLSEHIATHMEVKGISFQNEDEKTYFKIRSESVDNMKRIMGDKKEKRKSLDLALDFIEQKTVWHPIGF